MLFRFFAISYVVEIGDREESQDLFRDWCHKGHKSDFELLRDSFRWPGSRFQIPDLENILESADFDEIQSQGVLDQNHGYGHLILYDFGTLKFQDKVPLLCIQDHKFSDYRYIGCMNN